MNRRGFFGTLVAAKQVIDVGEKPVAKPEPKQFKHKRYGMLIGLPGSENSHFKKMFLKSFEADQHRQQEAIAALIVDEPKVRS